MQTHDLEMLPVSNIASSSQPGTFQIQTQLCQRDSLIGSPTDTANNVSRYAMFTNTFNLPEVGECTLSLQPYIRHITTCFSSLGNLFDSICPDGYNAHQQLWYIASVTILQKHISNQPHFSLESSAAYLRAEHLLRPSEPTVNNILTLHQYYIFCLVGISAHLFQPSAKGILQSVFPIEDCLPGTGHRCWSILSDRITVTQPRLPLSRIIRGFGELSPVMDGDQRSYQANAVFLRPEKFNAHLFCSVLKMKIRWTHILNAHLDYDAESRTIFMFKHPTFCLMNSTFAKGADARTIWDR